MCLRSWKRRLSGSPARAAAGLKCRGYQFEWRIGPPSGASKTKSDLRRRLRDFNASPHEVELADSKGDDLSRSKSGPRGEANEEPVLRIVGLVLRAPATHHGRFDDGFGERHDLVGVEEYHLVGPRPGSLDTLHWVGLDDPRANGDHELDSLGR